jgi:hypothetical protein
MELSWLGQRILGRSKAPQMISRKTPEYSHNPKVAGSNPAPATMNDEGLADAGAANPFRLPRNHPGSRSAGLVPACDATGYSITSSARTSSDCGAPGAVPSVPGAAGV